MTFNQSVKHFGSQASMAKALGVTPASVSQWKREGGIPENWQWKIQGITDGALKVDKKFIKPAA